MKKVVAISIPEPCHEDWAKMTETEKGRHCKVCTKEVVDFTTHSDEAIVKHMLKNKNACGRFKPQQLNRELVLERKSTASLAPYAASLLLPLTLLNGQHAQSNNLTRYAEKPMISLGIGSKPSTDKIQVTTTGKITDAEGNPLANVKITVKERNQSLRTFSDGTFTVTTLNDETLYFQLAGFDIQKYKVGRTNTNVAIVMNYSEVEIMLLGEIAPEFDEEIQGDVVEIVDVVEAETKEEITISGTVKDIDGAPILNAEVTVLETSASTRTDAQGNYSISALEGQSIVFGKGYLEQQDGIIGSENAVINIILQEVNNTKTVISGNISSVIMGGVRSYGTDLSEENNSEEKPSEENMITISGNVTDEEGLPLSGVNIVIKGSELGGTQSDFDGNYKITAGHNQTLEFSNVGMTSKTITLSNIDNIINVEMKYSLDMIKGGFIGGVVIIEVDTNYRSIGHAKPEYNPGSEERQAWREKRKKAHANEIEFKRLQKQARKRKKQ